MKFNVPTFVKWAGGKKQLLSQITERMPSKFNRYFEPFVGGGAVFFLVAAKYRKKSLISDTNEELITTFKVIKDNPKELIKLLKMHKKFHSENQKKHFYEIRALDLKNLTTIEIAARFIYLNKTCFNGLYRVNSKGQFNVPIGRYKNPKVVDEKNIQIASELLKLAEIKKMNFENILKFAKSGDFVYLDPPYYPLSKTSNFTSYTKEIFLENEQKKLAKVFKALDKKGCFVMLSNSACDFIRKLYEGFNIEVVEANRFINCMGSGRGKIKELIITNY